jgi:hypothetical protein
MLVGMCYNLLYLLAIKLLISAHFSQGVEVKVEPKLSNPIDATSEIGLKDFT